MQNPHLCFDQPDLKAGTTVCDMLGLPKVCSGNFASVYELHTQNSRWAIRCFVRQVLGHQARYARLSQHLSGVALEYMVKFEYIAQGIMVQGQWYPIVKMEWVDGLPLNMFVEANIHDPKVLLHLALEWRMVLRRLKENRLAHGDLQHGNVMVTRNNELRLVDYDGVYAPSFGKGRSPELGHANFQHPRRTPDYYDETLDNFSALVIYTSLLALSTEPALFQKFYTGDNLIFTAADFKAPSQSAVFTRLKQNPFFGVQTLSNFLELCCRVPAEKVPDFNAVMSALDCGTVDQFAAQAFAGIQMAEYNSAPPTQTTTSGTTPSFETAAPALVGAGAGAAKAAVVGAAAATPAPVTTGGTTPAYDFVPTGGTATRPSPKPATGGGRPGGPQSPGTNTYKNQRHQPSAAPTADVYPVPEEAESGDSKALWKYAAVFLLVVLLIGVIFRLTSGAGKADIEKAAESAEPTTAVEESKTSTPDEAR
jgi:hypothetical protein